MGVARGVGTRGGWTRGGKGDSLLFSGPGHDRPLISHRHTPVILTIPGLWSRRVPFWAPTAYRIPTPSTTPGTTPGPLHRAPPPPHHPTTPSPPSPPSPDRNQGRGLSSPRAHRPTCAGESRRGLEISPPVGQKHRGASQSRRTSVPPCPPRTRRPRRPRRARKPRKARRP